MRRLVRLRERGDLERPVGAERGGNAPRAQHGGGVGAERDLFDGVGREVGTRERGRELRLRERAAADGDRAPGQRGRTRDRP